MGVKQPEQASPETKSTVPVIRMKPTINSYANCAVNSNNSNVLYSTNHHPESATRLFESYGKLCQAWNKHSIGESLLFKVTLATDLRE